MITTKKKYSIKSNILSQKASLFVKDIWKSVGTCMGILIYREPDAVVLHVRFCEGTVGVIWPFYSTLPRISARGGVHRIDFSFDIPA